MKKLIYNPAAEIGGALTILNEYYQGALEDKENEYIFIVSLVDLVSKDNVKVIKFPWVKKSWLHRYYFDKIIAKKLIKKYKVDEVLSLQNIMLSNCKVRQGVYMHQAIPFSDYKFKLTYNFKLWIYQNIIGRMIIKSIRKVDYVIVQTEWLKNTLEKYRNKDTIFVVPPKIEVESIKIDKSIERNFNTFIYPAGSEVYKDHLEIIKACEKLKDEVPYKVYFTVRSDIDTPYWKDIYHRINKKNLPIEFIGYLTKEELFRRYQTSTLLFTSKIETFGLPLLEARNSEGIILAINKEYSKEILEGYNHAYFHENSDELSVNIQNQLKCGESLYNNIDI